MITPTEYQAQEDEKVKSAHEVAFERAMLLLEERVRGPGVYKLTTSFMGEPRSIEAAKHPALLALVAKEFSKRLSKAGWPLYVSNWGTDTWWRDGFIKVSHNYDYY